MQPLGDGLVMRRATIDDVDALCAFNGEVFRESDQTEPNEWVTTWTRDLMTLDHPTFRVEDFLIVEDSATRRIVSSLNLIPQTWTYGGIEFGVGQPELVGTDPDYRRRGLVRRQFEVIHGWSAERGHQLQAISGIPWFYRQFGYEMALEHNTGRILPRVAVPKLASGANEPCRVRAATAEDISFITEVDRQNRTRYLVRAVRDERQWRFELDGRNDRFGASLAVIESQGGQRLGFLAYGRLRWGNRLSVYAIELRRGTSWLAVGPTVLRYLGGLGDVVQPRSGAEPLESLGLWLGTEHPIYRLAGESVERTRGYAFYIRVPDLPAFLRHLAPVLEQRLAESIAVGHTGELRISFYRGGIVLSFTDGRLASVANFAPPQNLESGASFPGLTFLQLLFGWRSREQLESAYPDCFTRGNEAAVLLDVLFPTQPSHVWPIQ